MACYSPWSHKESDTTEHMQKTQHGAWFAISSPSWSPLFLTWRGKQLWACLPGTSHLGQIHRCQDDVMIKALRSSDRAIYPNQGCQRGPPGEVERREALAGERDSGSSETRSRIILS